MTLRTSDFDFELDDSLIAQHPTGLRDRSRLMVLRRSTGAREHRVFSELADLLRPGDLLVLNDTRVIPARFSCRRATGGRIDGLFVREVDSGAWEVLLKGAGRCKPGEALSLRRSERRRLVLEEDLGAGRWRLRPDPAGRAEEILGEVGATPLPPYIRRDDVENEPEDRDRYQTVYAAKAGAVAAPTAGLHFTRALLDRLAEMGVDTLTVTLHVGMGTFAPVKAEAPDGHQMHSEWYELSQEAATTLNRARGAGRRIVAVGTTSVRVLETVAAGATNSEAPFRAGSGWTDIFLHPPAEFHAIDALITNFHLPRSTLLMLVASFCAPGRTDGVETILAAYREAVQLRYRFFSYGDAMLIE
jgi:S-adenosylmethionine:tRNA ribosyltransferase-isomerase